MRILTILTNAFQESGDMDGEDSPCPSDICGQLMGSEGEIQFHFQTYERFYSILIKHNCFAV